MRVGKEYDLGPHPLKTIQVDSGDWNMDTTADIDVDVGIAFTRWRTMEVIIRNNANTDYRKLDFNGSASGIVQHTPGKGNTVMSLYRGAVGAFDGADYNSVDYNRAYITLGYN